MADVPPSAALRRYGPSFPHGPTEVIAVSDTPLAGGVAGGMEFGVRKLRRGETVTEAHALETAWVLLQGAAEIDCKGASSAVSRGNVFDDPPTALHVAARTAVEIRAVTDETEFAIVRTENERSFEPRVFLPAESKPEYRGAGLVQNACLRNVRLIFDRATRPESNLVVGEVINYPGRWSSYPPHHHDQPEIYHYRFTDPHGYGHAELGDEVVKIRHNDTLLIPPGHDHAQVSAPGYGMYYLWLIRHLPGNPYTGFTFAEEHTWTLDPARQGWRPPDLPGSLS